MQDGDNFHGEIHFLDGLTGEDVEQIGTYLVGPDKTGNARGRQRVWVHRFAYYPNKNRTNTFSLADSARFTGRGYC